MSLTFCYILQSCINPDRTYVGVTNDMTRRLRQHNGEIVGGAKYTHSYRPWRVICIIYNFPSESAVLQFEWRMHHVSGKIKVRKRQHNGLEGRYYYLEKILNLPQWTANAPHRDTMNLNLFWYLEEIPLIKIPSHYNHYKFI